MPRPTRKPVIAVLLAIAVLAATPLAVAAAWATMGYSSADEAALATWTNQQRASRGLAALATDGVLVAEARARAKDMGDRNYYSHTIPPDGHTAFDNLKARGYCFTLAGENFAWNNYPDDQSTTVVEGQLAGSPPHLANIIGTGWTRMGIGAYKDADGNHVFVVLFSQPCSGGGPAPTPTPAPPQPTARPAPTATPAATPQPTPVASPDGGVLGITTAYVPDDPLRAVPAPDPLIAPPLGMPHLFLRWLLDVFLAVIHNLLAILGGGR